MILYQTTPPQIDAHNLFMFRRFPPRGISMKSQTMCQSYRSPSIDNVPRNLEDRSTCQVQKSRVNCGNTWCHEVILKSFHGLIPHKSQIRLSIASQNFRLWPENECRGVDVAHEC